MSCKLPLLLSFANLFLPFAVIAASPAAPVCPLGVVSRAVEGPTPKPVISRKKQLWEAKHGGREAAKAHVVARLSERPQHLLIDKLTLPEDDQEFAWRLARDTWRGLRAMTDKENGLPVDHVIFPQTAVAGADAASLPAIEVGDYTNVTSVGLHLIAIVAARDLELISAREALSLLSRVLASLHKLERHRGLFFNYYDTTSMERTSRFLSFIDSAWLTAGLMVVRNAVPELRATCTKLIDATDYGFFYDRKTRQIAHGYFVQPTRRSPYDYGMLYTEARLGSLIAIGKGDVEPAHWAALMRVLPPGCDWQSLAPVDSTVRDLGGIPVLFGHYEWNQVKFLPSWGGSMFEALMPTLVLDEQRHAPASLGWNDRQHALVQQRYALEELAYPVWGMSPSARPQGGGYGEFGVPALGVRGYAAGAVAPYAAALALAVNPQAAMANLRQMAARYDSYGEYGFYDAVDPRSATVAYRYLALDQSMTFIALANHLRPHCVQQHFAADAIVKSFLPVLAAEEALWQRDGTAVAEHHGER